MMTKQTRTTAVAVVVVVVVVMMTVVVMMALVMMDTDGVAAAKARAHVVLCAVTAGGPDANPATLTRSGSPPALLGRMRHMQMQATRCCAGGWPAVQPVLLD